jgi:prolycopene isomerase
LIARGLKHGEAGNWKEYEVMSTEQNHPTVVIGAGLGGLCCGALLARHGVPVTIIEQHDKPGGYATAFGRSDGRFVFDVSLHGTAINDNAAARILDGLGVLDKIELVQLPEVYRLKTPDLDISVPQRDPEAYITLLAEHFPHEKDGIRGFVRHMVDLADEGDRFERSKGELDLRLFPVEFPKMWDIRDKTLADLLDEYVADPSLQEALAGLWPYLGLPPSRLSAFPYASVNGQYLKNGSFYIKPRSQALSQALAEIVEGSGGQIVYESVAEEILVADGAVTGVRLSDERVLPATAVVSNASAVTTLTRLLPEGSLPPEYHERISTYRPSVSTFIVWLGLNTELRGRTDAYSTHVSTGTGPEAEYEAGLRGDYEHSGFSVTVYDNAFEGYSRPGTSTVMLFHLSGWEPWRKFESDYVRGDREAYEAEKQRWSESLIRRAEELVIPGLSSMIEVKVTASPLTNWAYTGNTEGAIYGFEQSMDNTYMTRIQNETPVKGLYLAGAWGNPGGGFVGALNGGEAAFTALIESWAQDEPTSTDAGH